MVGHCQDTMVRVWRCGDCSKVSQISSRCATATCRGDISFDAGDGASMTCQQCKLPVCAECRTGPVDQVLSICDHCGAYEGQPE